MFGRALGFAITMLLMNTSDYDDSKEYLEKEKQRHKEELELERYKEALMSEVRNIKLVQPMTYN